MSNIKKDNKDENNGGFQVGKDGMSCFACKCKRKNLIKDKKKVIDEKEGKIVLEEVVETSIISFGRDTTPEIQPRTLTIEERIEELERKIDEINNKKIKDIDTGFRSGISVDERLLKLEREVHELKQVYQLQLMD